MATLKHINSKNADYGAAEQYLLFEHDEFTMKPVLDETGRLIPREDYRLSTLNCDGEDFAVACMRANLRYQKNQRREDVKSHHYIISFDPRDGPDNGLTVDRAQALGEQFCKEHFPGHQALVCTHPDGHNHSGNIHVHIVINSLRIEEVPFLPYMDRPADTKVGCKHRCTDAALRYFKSEVMEMASRGAAVTLTSKAHQAVSEYEDDNIGVQVVQETTKAVESTAYTVDHAVYSHKLKAYDKAEKLVEKSDKANVNALYEKFKKDNPDAASNPISRWKQKQAIKKEYAAAKAGKGTAKETAAKATKKAAQSTKTITEKAMEFCTTHSKTILFVLIAGLLFMILSGMFSSCSAMFQGGTQIVLGTSFTAKEEDIIGADNDYKALEAALRNEINNIERTHSGYDEYRYDLDEINHNPYELAAYLTVKFEDYTRDEVQATLQWLFEQQYELTLTEVVEIRTRTTSYTDPETGETTTEEEDYEYYILKVKLRNKGLNSVISNSGLSEDDMERYRILLQTRGNRPDIFGNDIYATPGGEYTDYDIPGEALTDTRFANMIREAEKYLGYPYVWGGSSPSTSFDCSGFVSYVINHCGNGWSVGRLTANGLMGVCDIIPKSSAKPGDLIFFQGTYDTSGASHVGIYVGNGMMIHCGNPISYASIESNYWQQHFYCFGRIRN